ncbi:MAG TPA: LLM class flavin-dependent oxidoreductase, partial [Acidimicrobiales bacterium]|nr:LLM class flavin-dependent oxidoreductase [Acidimicrobiales bacterium]
GRFFSMPERNVLPKPYVKPHPPMWVAAGNPDTFEKAGRLGLGVICFTGGSPEKMRPLVEIYKEAVADAEPVGDYVNDNVAIATSFMCLEDGDAARRHMTTSRNGRQQSLVFKYLDTFPKPPGIPDWPQEIPDPTLEEVEAGFRKGASIVGTPDDCAEALEKWEAIGVDQLIMGPTGSAWPYELVEESVELLGTKVIPRFDPEPEARAVRFRREAAQRLGLA